MHAPVGSADGASRGPRRAARAIAPITLLLLGLAGCSGAGDPSAAPEAPGVATFEIEGQRFRIELSIPELVRHAKRLLEGEDVAAIPVGRIVRGDPSVNEPWSWHIDPQTLEFADLTTEVCDGLPEFVEDGTLTSDTYCPWLAKVVAVEPLE